MAQWKKLSSVGLIIALIISFFASEVCGADRPTYKRTIQDYRMPDVTLFNQDGENVKIKELVKQGKVVILDFIFGTGTTMCPVLSASFVNFQNKLGSGSDKVQLISISIDPEHDTPRVLKGYLKKFRAKPGWDFLTGGKTDIESIMHAFNAYTVDKMTH